MKSKRRLWSDLSIKEAQNLRSCCCLLVCWPYKIVRGMVYQEPQEYQTECKTRTKLYDTNENIPFPIHSFVFLNTVNKCKNHVLDRTSSRSISPFMVHLWVLPTWDIIGQSVNLSYLIFTPSHRSSPNLFCLCGHFWQPFP